jgi:hypothetical protein
MGIQGVVVFVFWKGKKQRSWFGETEEFSAHRRKFLRRGRHIFGPLGGNFELWNQAVIFLKGS